MVKSDPKLIKLLDALKDLNDKQALVIEEFGALLGGGIGIGAQMKAFYTTWAQLWEARYRGTYSFAFTKDAPQVKRLIQKLGLEELQQRAVNYIRSSDEFVLKTKHSFAAFVATINTHASVTEYQDRPSNCKHQPSCIDDANCTKRTQREVLEGADVTRSR